MNWHEYFIKIANVVRQKSKDPSSKVGVVIVSKNNEILSTGFNGFCRNIQEYSNTLTLANNEATLSNRWERPEKYLWVEHGERNAIYNAARNGIKLLGSKLYLVAFGPPTVPCVDCTKAIIQSGIKYVYGYAVQPAREEWKKDFDFCLNHLEEAGIIFVDLTRDGYLNT